MLPLIQIADKQDGEVITQVYNFMDLLGGQANLNVDNVEQFLMARGILEPTIKIDDPKFHEAYAVTGESSYLNQKRHNNFEEHQRVYNVELAARTEEKTFIEYEAATIDYKHELLEAYKMVHDPFNVELQDGILDFEQNPADLSKPTQTGEITEFVPIFQ